MSTLASSLRFGGLVLLFSAIVGWRTRGVYPLDVTAVSGERAVEVGSSAASVAATVASVSATMLGFLIAALAILASIAGMRLLRNMQRTGHYQILLGRLLMCVAALALLLCFSLAAMFAPLTWPALWQIVFGCMAAALLTFIDAMRKFGAVLFALKPPDQSLE